jgi:hypothetical protein
MRTQFFKFVLLVLLVFSNNFTSLLGQEVLNKKKIEIQGKGPVGTFQGLFELFGKNFFTMSGEGYDKIYYGGQLFSGNLADTLVENNRQDQFIFELGPSLEITDYYVIDNCEQYNDHTNTDEYGIMLVNFDDNEDADSLAVMTLPEGIEFKRRDYLNQSLLIVTDSNFNYIEHLVPTTGKILRIEGGRENLYMTIRIPKGESYILVGQDTIHNIYQILGYESALIAASFDLGSNSFNWIKFIGSTYLDYIYDLDLDTAENLILLVNPWTNIELIGEDTIGLGTGPHYNIVIKLDKNGHYIWSENFEESRTEYFFNINLDDKGNIYLQGSIQGNTKLLDTIIDVGDLNEPPSQAILLKLNSDGKFNWVYRIPGEYILNGFNYFHIDKKNENIYLNGSIQSGIFYLNGKEYVNPINKKAAYMLKLGSNSGSLNGYNLFQEMFPPTMRDITEDKNGNILTYVSVRDDVQFLDELLTPFGIRPAAYLLQITSDWDSIVFTKELNSGLFRLFPNPIKAGEEIVIELNDQWQSQDLKLVLVNAQGLIIRTITNSGSSVKMATSGLPSGVYAFCVYDKMQYKATSIIIQ